MVSWTAASAVDPDDWTINYQSHHPDLAYRFLDNSDSETVDLTLQDMEYDCQFCQVRGIFQEQFHRLEVGRWRSRLSSHKHIRSQHGLDYG